MVSIMTNNIGSRPTVEIDLKWILRVTRLNDLLREEQ